MAWAALCDLGYERPRLVPERDVTTKLRTLEDSGQLRQQSRAGDDPEPLIGDGSPEGFAGAPAGVMRAETSTAGFEDGPQLHL